MSGETLTCGSYCPSCGWEIIKLPFLTLEEWNARRKGQPCPHCHDELMPQEFHHDDALLMWATINPHN
jgi:hypothetical protein